MDWEKSFEIGCEKVDLQHKELVNLVSQFEESLKAKVSGKQLADILRFLVSYTKYHFFSEETFMEEIKFPDIDKHRKIHDDLIESITGILLSLKAGETLDPDKLYLFLVNWVKDHILEEDKKIGKFYRDGQEETPELQKEKQLSEERILTVKKHEELKLLFANKLINSEDFAQQRIKIVTSIFEKYGLTKLPQFFSHMDFLIKTDLLTETDKKNISQKIFHNLDLEESLAQVTKIENKLFLLRSFNDLELVSKESIESHKEKILQEL